MDLDRLLGKRFDLTLADGQILDVRLSSVNRATNEAMLHVYPLPRAGLQRMPTRWDWVRDEIKAGRMVEAARA